MGIYVNNFKLKILFIALLSTLIAGCDTKSSCNSTYFGGNIINPKSDYVVLYKNEIPLDTFFLDKNNSFLGEIPALHEGLYNFKHGEEEQYIYLNPKDSLLIRLNTWKFDETLVFSGVGAERNNLLIDSFLESEKDSKVFIQYFKLSPSDFNSKIIQAEKIKLDRYEDYVSKHPNETDKFKNVFKIALTYPLYSKIENYPLARSARGNYNENDPLLPKNNYSWSKLGGESAVHMYPNSLILRVCMTEKPFVHNKAFGDFITNFIFHEDIAKYLFKLIDKKGVINVGGKTQSVYNFAKKYNPKIKKTKAKKILGSNYPLNPSMNISKLKKILK